MSGIPAVQNTPAEPGNQAAGAPNQEAWAQAVKQATEMGASFLGGLGFQMLNQAMQENKGDEG